MQKLFGWVKLSSSIIHFQKKPYISWIGWLNTL